MGLTILGVILSTLHQSSLGALYLIAPSKLHPLWYTPYLPLMFFLSSMVRDDVLLRMAPASLGPALKKLRGER